MRALCRLPESPHYGKQAFEAGLRSAGYEVVPQISKPSPGDLIVVWNRQSGYHEQASNFESAGGRVVVVENAYLTPPGGSRWFAVALHHHAGAGEWRDHGPQRWDGWQVPLAPWRTDGAEVLILGQRCIGEPDIASPSMWAEKLHKRLPNSRIRQHPGPQKAQTGKPLIDDLKNASAVATWASSAGLLALVAGVPVFCDFPKWIGASACRTVDDLLAGEEPKRDDAARLAMFRRLAWSVWNVDEVSSGEAFAHLLAIEGVGHR